MSEEISVTWQNYSLKHIMDKPNFSTIVYMFWKERNDRIFSNGKANKMVLIKRIIKVVEKKPLDLAKISSTQEN